MNREDTKEIERIGDEYFTLKNLRPKKVNSIYYLQNSFFTRWIWRCWRHEDTGRICLMPFWKNPGKRYRRTNMKE
jgi:hypothetical protein